MCSRLPGSRGSRRGAERVRRLRDDRRDSARASSCRWCVSACAKVRTFEKRRGRKDDRFDRGRRYCSAVSPVAFHVPGDEPLTTAAMLYPADAAARLDALFVFAHGAGAGQSHPFMVRYARGLAERGIDVVTFNFPYMEAGRKIARSRAGARRRFSPRRRRRGRASARQRDPAVHRRQVDGRPHGDAPRRRSGEWPATRRRSGVIAFGYPLRPPGGLARPRSRLASAAHDACRR